jgi:hypothetical protein
MSALDKLDWGEVRKHYKQRVEIHRQLLSLYHSKKVTPFVRLLLGVSDPAGNYSADEHKLGPQILAGNPADNVPYALAISSMEVGVEAGIPVYDQVRVKLAQPVPAAVRT